MLSNIKKRKLEEGFTIIEVLIVLAIAGLILLIVFLAVPALERNARNTQRKNDVAGMLSGITNFTDDNNGTEPTGAAFASGEITFSGPAGTTTIDTNKVGFYTGAPTMCTTSVAGGSCTAPTAGTSSVTTATIVIGAVCNGNAPTTTGATGRSVAIFYGIEQGGNAGSVDQCTSG